MSEQDSDFERDGLTIRISKSASGTLVSLLGVSDSRHPGLVLRPVLEHVMQAVNGSKVTLDFTNLEYMNSSTVSPIINLIKTLDAAGIETLVLFSDVDWQRTHCRCMKTIARALEHVRVEGGDPDSSGAAGTPSVPPMSWKGS